jgi:hypothetical protein
MRHVIWQPISLAPAEYPLPGNRATFYVPRSDDNPRGGRRLMYMRDLACCAGTKASYSTASDLVRVGLASRGSINGELAGGMVMSLMRYATAASSSPCCRTSRTRTRRRSAGRSETRSRHRRDEVSP